MLRVLKYATGHEIPKGAVFLSTQVEKTTSTTTLPSGDTESTEENTLVWHYFLVECDDEGNPPPCRPKNPLPF